MTAVTERAAVTTVPARIRRRALETPEVVALREKRLGIWQEVSWRRYWEQVELAAHGLAALGVEPGDRVAVHSENRPEWLYADVATVALRAMTVGLYPTNPPAEVAYLLADSGAKVLVAEDQEQVDKALEVSDQLPALERIVYVEPRGVRAYDDPRLLSWSELLALGGDHRQRHPGLLDERAAQVAADDVVTLIYTSGTTGPPKGAMLTLANIDFAIKVLVDDGGFFENPGPDDVTLSYLPLCHVAERIATEWENAAAGTQVHFAESIDTVQDNLREVQPTLFFAVPRIWEKIRATVEIRMASASPLKRANYRLWMGQAARIGADAGGQRRHPHPLDPAALRPRLPVPVPVPAQAARPAALPLRRVGGGADRPRAAAVVLRARGGHPRDLRHDREQRRGHRQPPRPGQGRHRRRAPPRGRAPPRRGSPARS